MGHRILIGQVTQAIQFTQNHLSGAGGVGVLDSCEDLLWLYWGKFCVTSLRVGLLQGSFGFYEEWFYLRSFVEIMTLVSYSSAIN